VVRLTLDSKERQEALLLRALDDAKPDLALSVQYPWILSSAVIQVLDGKILNLHNARLPDYRGHHSISHALLNGDSTYTSTLHWMAPEVDRGYSVDTETIDILPDDTAQSLWLRTVESCMVLMDRLFDRAKRVEDIPQGSAIGFGGRFYSRKMLDSLRRVPVDASVHQMALIARAFHFPPFEPAYIEIGGRKTYLLAGDYRYRVTEQGTG
jgi:methionyl-tRNA formyltransferase